MEQDEALYEYKLAHEVFRFEAHSLEEAEKVRSYAILHFAERLGRLFDEAAIVGPERVNPRSLIERAQEGSDGAFVGSRFRPHGERRRFNHGLGYGPDERGLNE